jgi:flagellar motor component MotA
VSDTIIVALLSLGGTLIGTFGGILTSNRLTVYRIQKLEEKVEKHNNLVERMYDVEGEIDNIKTEIKLRHGG